MKITLPVPYEMNVRLEKSRVGRTEQVLACTSHTFEVDDHSSLDVHLVAEWQQAWNGALVEGWTPKASRNWLDDFKNDSALSRLIMIDGSFYSPLKVNWSGRHQVVSTTAEDIATPAWKIESIQTITGSYLHSLWYGEHPNLMSRGNFWEQFESLGRYEEPDLRFRTILESQEERMKLAVARWLKQFAIVDGLLWARIEEPVIGVFVLKDTVRMKVTDKRESANSENTSYFSFNDFDSAFDHFMTNVSGRTAIQEISDLKVLMPEAFRMRVEAQELLKSTSYLLETIKPMLADLPSDVAPFWYALRDTRAGCTSLSSDDEMEQLKERTLDLAAAINNHPNAPAALKQMSSFSNQLVDRWDLRPL